MRTVKAAAVQLSPVSYDSMASLLAPYGSESALAIAGNLDAKIEALLETAAR